MLGPVDGDCREDVENKCKDGIQLRISLTEHEEKKDVDEEDIFFWNDIRIHFSPFFFEWLITCPDSRLNKGQLEYRSWAASMNFWFVKVNNRFQFCLQRIYGDKKIHQCIKENQLTPVMSAHV
jgi:hypothetical protein